MMYKFIAVAVLACSASAALAAPDVTGNWVTQDRTGLVSITKCGRGLCGTIAKALVIRPNHPHTDVHNPNPALRDRTVVGLQILSGFAPDGDQWDGGRIYDPESGKTYKSVLKLNSDGSLKVSGCVLFFCQSQRWTRR